MRPKLVWWWLLSLLLITALVGLVYDTKDMLAAELIVMIAYAFYLLSPTGIMLGTVHKGLDALTVFGFLLSSWYVIGDVFFGTEEALLLVIGVVILAISSFMMVRMVKPRTGMYGVFSRARRQPRPNPAVLFILLIAMFTVFFRQELSRSLFLTLYPFTLVLFSIPCLWWLAARTDRFGMRQAQVAKRMMQLALEFRKLFFNKRTVLLGISGLLIFYFSFDIFASLLLAFPAILSIKVPLDFAAAMLSWWGSLVIYLIPLYMWFKIFQIRITGRHVHLPDWSRAMISASYAGMAFLVLFPVLAYARTPEMWDMLLLTVHQGIGIRPPEAALIAAGIFFVLASIVGGLDHYLRRIMMVGPFFAGTVLLGMYIFAYFYGQFVQHLGKILSLAIQMEYAAAMVFLLFFLVNAFFYVAGFLSFLYEVGRD
ncbi:hypothetical protein GOV11_01825 [Candidatus Woesearchaeota archaeon]|nr:hypothetical protein [Candidatus Woesearchaeota archaeon]